jgi:hypothetical protein
MKNIEKAILTNNFKLYFHDPNSNDWSKESYILVDEIKDIYKFWYLNNNIKEYLHKGMFFMMRNNIFPLWDIFENIGGSTFSMKIDKEKAEYYWIIISSKILTNTFIKKNFKLKDIKDEDIINGYSLSPKKNNCIIKIWLRKNNLVKNDENLRNIFNIPSEYTGELLYKPN